MGIAKSIAAAVAVVTGLASAGAAQAEDMKIAIGISGWTGFAPLILAKDAGIFKKNGVDATIKMIPQTTRHLAIKSGDIQCAATTVETWIAWNAAGVPTTQIFMMDRSHGADGLAVRNDIKSIADLKGKKVAAWSPGTAPYFLLAWFLKKNGVSIKDVSVVNLDSRNAANAFVTGQDIAGAATYEPYLSTIRAKPETGKIIATTLDYPMVMDTFGCAPAFLKANHKTAEAVTKSYFEALAMIKADPMKSFAIMGAPVKQDAKAFEKSQSYLRWQDKAANQKFFGGEIQAFMKEAAPLLLEIGVIKSVPNLDSLVDASFVK
ncbi:MAG: ABC transporter substrate-binding protein [Rhodospirillaceae bacterium]|nr:ABC transporter substrate-binding protein [Rhodospirillaceae bacterium]